jgi:hypothetical protein
MPRSPFRNGLAARRAFASRLAIFIAATTLVGGCTTGLPQRRPGSNTTLPQSSETRLLRALISPCDATADSVPVRARNVVDCGLAKPEKPGLREPQRTGPAQQAP